MVGRSASGSKRGQDAFGEQVHVVHQFVEGFAEKNQPDMLRARCLQCPKLLDEPLWRSDEIAFAQSEANPSCSARFAINTKSDGRTYPTGYAIPSRHVGKPTPNCRLIERAR